MSNLDCIFNAVKSVKRTSRAVVKRAYVSRAGKDDKPYNITQISYSNPLKTADSEVINPYGLYTNLPEGIQTILFAVGGDEGNKACIGYSQNDRFKNLKPGEVLVGNPALTTFVKFDNEGNIEIESTNDVTIKSAAKTTMTVGTEFSMGCAKIEINNSGPTEIISSGVVSIECNDDIDIKSTGDINIDNGGDINIENGSIKVTGDADITANNVNLNATKVNLGVGGNKIARLGDEVTVNTGTGIGTITSAGTNTSI